MIVHINKTWFYHPINHALKHIYIYIQRAEADLGIFKYNNKQHY